MRDLLEAARHASRRACPEPTLAELTRYTKLFWINTRPVQQPDRAQVRARPRSRARSSQRCEAAAPTARASARGRASRSPRCVDALRADVLRSPTFDPMVTCKTPGDGQDILASSANNLYDGVTMADLEGFDGAASAELAPGEARRPARRRGLHASAAATTSRSGSIVGHLRDAACRSRRRRSRAALRRAGHAGTRPATTAIARRSTSPGCRTATRRSTR